MLFRSEIKNGTLVAKFRPKNNIIISLLDHFSDRFPSERLVLIDLNRNIFGFSYLGDKHLVVASEMPPLIDHLETTQDEDLLSELWCCFVGTIAIKERTNKKLQQQHVPLRYQGEMVEFKKVLVQDPLSYLIPPV